MKKSILALAMAFAVSGCFAVETSKKYEPQGWDKVVVVDDAKAFDLNVTAHYDFSNTSEGIVLEYVATNVSSTVVNLCDALVFHKCTDSVTCIYSLSAFYKDSTNNKRFAESSPGNLPDHLRITKRSIASHYIYFTSNSNRYSAHCFREKFIPSNRIRFTDTKTV